MRTEDDTQAVRFLDALPAPPAGSPGTWLVATRAWPAHPSRHDEASALAAWLLLQGRVLESAEVRLTLCAGPLHLSMADVATASAWVALVAQALQSPVASSPGDPLDDDPAWSRPDRPAPDRCALHASLGVDGQLCLRAFAPAVHADSLETLLDLWAGLLQRMLAQPSQALSALALLPPDSVHGLHSPAWAYAGPLDIPSRFMQVAQQRDQAPAVLWSDGQMSYQALAQASRVLAQALVSAGVAPGDTVAVSQARSPHAVVALLAVLRAGAAYLPLDLAMPPSRLRFMVQDAGARLLLAEAEEAQADAAGLARLAPSQASRASQASASLPALPPPPAPEAAAYVMYTSGSTGQPKAVVVPHRAVLRLVGACSFMALDADTVMLQAAPLSFDAATLELWGPLLNGGRCVLHSEDVPTGAGLAHSIRSLGVNAAWLTSSLFNAVVDEDPRHLAGLQVLLTGGEALSPDPVRRFAAAVPGTALINGYGPTETTTFATTHRIERAALATARSIPIGRPVDQTSLYVLNRQGQPLPAGLVGELYIGGQGVALGYLGRPELTVERFVPDRFGPAGGRLYRTGDLVCQRSDGTLDFIGRADGQVKLRGHRVELGEVQAALSRHPDVRACTVQALKHPQRGTELVAYVVPQHAGWSAAALHQHLAAQLPAYMLPGHWLALAELPRTPNGKLDTRALPAPAASRPDHLSQPYQAPRAGLEQQVAQVLAQVLGLAPGEVGAQDNFFDLGGNSLLAVRAQAALRDAGLPALAATALFATPTVRGLVAAMRGPAPRAASAPAATLAGEPVAIVGMAGRFPGATDIEAFWALLDEGRDAIRTFLPHELDAAVPAALRADPQYVPARGVLDAVDQFDAAFFGISPLEAELMDPQQRVFLELCWECLERAGQVPEHTPAPIGVFAGMYNASYHQRHVLAHPDKVARLGEFQVMLANEKDYIATRTAHRLNLTGPAVSVHTACSTSLVAVVQAVDALRAGHCGLALAGGVSITCPPASGYLYQEGSMLSPDGHTRAFDAAAQGTVFSDGAAVVLLKRLSDALADGNTIHAVLRGVAVNNDGADKASFTAPSVAGQAAVVGAALAQAGVPARSISYVEAHGTATPLGDPVEVAALTQAFRAHTADTGFCTLGSLKSNTGHMVTAAGAAGLIKVALALQHQRLPGTVHFRQANPRLELDSSPFVVRAEASAWPRAALPRRAGVSSFGVGGTNAHVVVEEAPEQAPPAPGQGPQLLRLSARTPQALAAGIERLARHLERHPDLDMADVAHTLALGRRTLAHRSWVVAANAAEAVAALRAPDGSGARPRAPVAAEPAVVLAFPGQGAQYAGMGRSLHAAVPAFASAFDEALAAAEPHAPAGLAAHMWGDDDAPLAQTALTQPATFVMSYALARCWLAQGVQPAALVGHSVGEFVAAVLAGVMPLAHAAALVARRGALMQALPPGRMLAVRLPAAELLPLLPPQVQLAADNAPQACVAAGPTEAMDALALMLQARGVQVRPLATSHAFHSDMMAPAVPAFQALVAQQRLAAPRLRIVSTATGTWLSDSDATSPEYWARHLRAPVRFSPALQTLLSEWPQALMLEAGPRGPLTALARQHRVAGVVPQAVASGSESPAQEHAALVQAAGQLWAAGVPLAWPAMPATGRRRVVLPPYAFQRQRHWLDAAPPLPATLPAPATQAAAPAAPPIMPTPPTPAAPRRPALVQRLRGVFEDVSGLDMADAPAAASFVELGLDSLTLTQVALQLKASFGVPVSFRQLMETWRSLDSLAAHLDDTLPPEAAATPTALAPAAVVTGPAVALLASAAAPDGSLLQQVIAQQMALMAQQLALLQGQAGAAPTALSSASAPVALPVAATAVATAPSEEEAALAHRRYDVNKAFGAIARIHSSGTELSQRQRLRLDAFIQRYTAKTAGSKAYTVQHRPHLADPRVVNGFRPALKEIVYQLVMERSKGARLWDLDGNEYVDALNGFGMSLFGWQPDFVLDAVRAQLDSGYDIGPQHPLAGEVARLVCQLTGFDRAGLCNTGSEAVMGCVRIARTVTGRSRIALFSGAYHGIFDEVIVRGTRKGRAVPAAPGILPSSAENVVVLDYGTPEALQWLKDNAHDLAAVLVEPVQSRRPDFQPREFLQALRDITQQAGALLVFDEVVTGFRCHPGGIQALWGLQADLASYGKVVGGGFPIGIIAGKREYMDTLDGGHWDFGDSSTPTVGVTYFAGTFVRHPLALVAARAVLQHLHAQGPQLQASLTHNTATLVEALNAHCREVGAPIVLNHFASVWKLAFTEDHPLQDLLFAMMRNRGVHILDNFPCFMTTAHGPAELAAIQAAFKEAVAELQAADFLPRRAATPATSLDAAHPPVPGARLGRDAQGQPAWFVPNPDLPGKYLQVGATA